MGENDPGFARKRIDVQRDRKEKLSRLQTHIGEKELYGKLIIEYKAGEIVASRFDQSINLEEMSIFDPRIEQM